VFKPVILIVATFGLGVAFVVLSFFYYCGIKN